ncbi:MAG: SGNH/GDSL hydrolase family protein [Deinococcota bacterium]
MQQVLVYGDSLSWGIIPGTRERLPFGQRWPNILEAQLEQPVRVIEDCLNGRRTVWEDPFKSGRAGIVGLEQRIEVNSPLDLVILFLGTNDFQSMHPHTAWHAAQGVAHLVRAIRSAPIEPSMTVSPILIIAPPAPQAATGTMQDKFAGAEDKAIGLAQHLADVAEQHNCAFFDAGSVITTSPIDGVHLEAEQHRTLGNALIKVVAGLL